MGAPNECARDLPRWERYSLCLTALALALWWTVPLSMARTWGWDESMHAELPAVRMLLALRAGAIREACDVLLGCAQYPFAYPVALTLVQSITGVSEAACRVAGTLVWCAALVGLHSLARELSPRMAMFARVGASSRRAFPWLVMALAASSPLCLAYAGTLFLEVPFACAAVFTLRAWIRRRVEPFSRRRELAAGAWLTVCIFTKFNYGLLLASALALDWLCDVRSEVRDVGWRRLAQRSFWLCALPIVVTSWWFVWPWPAGWAEGTSHRIALLEFLEGNRGGARVPNGQRLLYLAGYLALTPRLFLFALAGACAAISLCLDRSMRCVALAFLCLAVPLWIHPFHLDRFWIPVAVPFWILASVGSLRWAARAARRPVVVLAGMVALCCVPIGDREMRWLAQASGQWNAEPRLQVYQLEIYSRWRDLSGARALPTAGLLREEFQRLMEPIAREVGPAERWGWIGVSSEVSPAAVSIGLLERGGSPLRFRRDADRSVDVTYFAADPTWDDAELGRFAQDFDVILFTQPIDLKDRPARRFMGEYARRLTEELGWTAREIGTFDVSRPLAEPRAVTLFACRATR